jgi:hypothetical protein
MDYPARGPFAFWPPPKHRTTQHGNAGSLSMWGQPLRLRRPFYMADKMTVATMQVQVTALVGKITALEAAVTKLVLATEALIAAVKADNEDIDGGAP